MLLGVAGLSGSMKGMSKKGDGGGCLLGLFSIGIMVFFVFFLAATIFFFVGPEAIFGTDCTTGSKTTFINELYATSNEADTLFCQAGCACKINNPSELYDIVSPVGNVDPVNGFEKFGDCPGITSSTTNI